jgi:hypothetical protein
MIIASQIREAELRAAGVERREPPSYSATTTSWPCDSG